MGGGLSGLRCAGLLRDQGVSVRVIEARDRLGGRVLTEQTDHGAIIDLGAQWIGVGQDRVARLAADNGVETFPTWTQGQGSMELGGKIKRYTGTIPPLPLLSLGRLEWTLRRAARELRDIDRLDPMAHAGAEALDRTSLETWVDRSLPKGPAREAFDLALRIVFGAEANELSALYVLHYARAAGGMMPLVETEGGLQERRFVQGSVGLIEALSRDLDVVLNAPVRRVVQTDDGVTLHTDTGAHHGKRLVVTAPPPLAARIQWEPGLPAARDQLTQRMAMGATIKFIAFYETPFWRSAGLSGEAVSGIGPACYMVDDSGPNGEHAALLGFVVGSQARRLNQLPEDEQWRQVLQGFARVFGPQALRPHARLSKDWSNDPWTRGCPVAFMTPGTLADLGDHLSRPVGRIHWAGTETATEHRGFMEGALQSAERAASEVLAAL